MTTLHMITHLWQDRLRLGRLLSNFFQLVLAREALVLLVHMCGTILHNDLLSSLQWDISYQQFK